MTIVVSSLAQHQRWRHRINVDSTLVMFVTLFRCWADVSLLVLDGILQTFNDNEQLGLHNKIICSVNSHISASD